MAAAPSAAERGATVPDTPPRRNVVVVAGVVIAGIAGTIAFMLWLAYSQMMDYSTYDTDYASAFATGTGVFAALAATGAVAATIASVRRRHRRG